jgi:hypothetical protein
MDERLRIVQQSTRNMDSHIEWVTFLYENCYKAPLENFLHSVGWAVPQTTPQITPSAGMQ